MMLVGGLDTDVVVALATYEYDYFRCARNSFILLQVTSVGLLVVAFPPWCLQLE